MPDRITFTQAVLLGFARRKEGTAQFAAPLTQSAAKALGWSEIPDFLNGAQPDGDLHATLIELVPSEPPLAKHAVELDVSRVHKFELVRLELENKNGKGHRLEVRFTAVFGDQKGCRKLEEYMMTCGDSRGKLTVSYSKQENLALDEKPRVTEEQQKALAVSGD